MTRQESGFLIRRQQRKRWRKLIITLDSEAKKQKSRLWTMPAFWQLPPSGSRSSGCLILELKCLFTAKMMAYAWTTMSVIRSVTMMQPTGCRCRNRRKEKRNDLSI